MFIRKWVFTSMKHMLQWYSHLTQTVSDITQSFTFSFCHHPSFCGLWVPCALWRIARRPGWWWRPSPSAPSPARLPPASPVPRGAPPWSAGIPPPEFWIAPPTHAVVSSPQCKPGQFPHTHSTKNHEEHQQLIQYKVK